MVNALTETDRTTDWDTGRKPSGRSEGLDQLASIACRDHGFFVIILNRRLPRLEAAYA
jgi:hypothetical protein